MFNPSGCFCCEPNEEPCITTGCTWPSVNMPDSEISTEAYYSPESTGIFDVSSSQDTTAGNDAPSRLVTIETTSPPTSSVNVYAVLWRTGAVHTPSTQCRIDRLLLCVESKRHPDSDGGLSDGIVFVLRQNGKTYQTHQVHSVGVNWRRASGTYEEGDFVEIGGSGRPDFSTNGSAIQFGVALKIAVSAGDSPFDSVRLDNLCIRRARGCVGCDPLAYDYVDTGTGTVVAAAGIPSSSYSIGSSSSDGNSGDCIKITLNENRIYSFRYHKSIQEIMEEAGVEKECLDPFRVYFCFDASTEGLNQCGVIVPGGGGVCSEWTAISGQISIAPPKDLSTTYLTIGFSHLAGLGAIAGTTVLIDNVSFLFQFEPCLDAESIDLELSGFHMEDSGACASRGCLVSQVVDLFNEVISSPISLSEVVTNGCYYRYRQTETACTPVGGYSPEVLIYYLPTDAILRVAANFGDGIYEQIQFTMNKQYPDCGESLYAIDYTINSSSPCVNIVFDDVPAANLTT